MLKSPFVVHPKTGKICVPIDPKSPHDFDPNGVPTVLTLQRELDAEITRRRKEKDGEEETDEKEHKEGEGEEEKKEGEGEATTAMEVDGAPKKRRRLDASGSSSTSSTSSSSSSSRSLLSATSLAPYVKFFRDTFVAPMAAEQRAEFRRVAETEAAAEVDDW